MNLDYWEYHSHEMSKKDVERVLRDARIYIKELEQENEELREEIQSVYRKYEVY